jgi:hypothetical protein
MEYEELIRRLSKLTDERLRVKLKIQSIANYATLRGEVDTATALINLVHKMDQKSEQ